MHLNWMSIAFSGMMYLVIVDFLTCLHALFPEVVTVLYEKGH